MATKAQLLGPRSGENQDTPVMDGSCATLAEVDTRVRDFAANEKQLHPVQNLLTLLLQIVDDDSLERRLRSRFPESRLANGSQLPVQKAETQPIDHHGSGLPELPDALVLGAVQGVPGIRGMGRIKGIVRWEIQARRTADSAVYVTGRCAGKEAFN